MEQAHVAEENTDQAQVADEHVSQEEVLHWQASEMPVWFPPAFSDAQMMLPYWNDAEEKREVVEAILEFHTMPCEDFQRGYCAKHGGGRGRVSRCSFYHFESQSRRRPVSMLDGQLTYWDAPCDSFSSELGYCPNGEACPFAHGKEEVSYHPAKYKTRLCNVQDCRGEDVCCFAHGDNELRSKAFEQYSCFVIASRRGIAAHDSVDPHVALEDDGSFPQFTTSSEKLQKHRFCASYPNVSQCRRGSSCVYAHAREEITTELFTLEEEELKAAILTEGFFTTRFKTLWCPVGGQHDWQTCVYAHTYQDARRLPSIGYGPQPCPFWSKKETRAAYAQRCPLGLRCPYSHGAKEQLYHPKYFRTVVCRDLQMRGCPRQHLCAFHHRRAEKRNASADIVDYSKPISKNVLPSDWADNFLAPPLLQERSLDEGPMMSQMGNIMMYSAQCWSANICSSGVAAVDVSVMPPHMPGQEQSEQRTDAPTPSALGGVDKEAENGDAAVAGANANASVAQMSPYGSSTANMETNGFEAWADANGPYYGGCYDASMMPEYYGVGLPTGASTDNQWWPQEEVVMS